MDLAPEVERGRGARGRIHAALAAAEARQHAREEEVEEAGRRLREVIRERAISLGTMDVRLRLVTALAFLQLAVAAVLVALRDSSLPTVALNAVEGEQTAISAPAFWITVVSLSLAWAYALGGLLHGHRIARVGALCLFSATVYTLWDTPLPLATPRMIPSYLLLAAVWAVGLHQLRRSPEEDEGQPRRLRLAMVPVLWLLGGGLYLAFWWRLRPLHDERFFTLAVFHQLQIASFALVPVLFVAGVDFAEWGDVAASRAAAVHRLRSPRRLGALAFVAAAGALAYRVDVASAGDLARGFGLGALFLGVVVALVAVAGLRRPRASRVPYAVVFASSVILYGLLLGVSYAAGSSSQTAPTVALRHATAPRFQLEYPLSWQPIAEESKVGIHVFGVGDPAEGAQLFVFAVPKAVASVLGSDLRERFFKAPATVRRHEGGWQVTDFRLPGKLARSWQRSAGRTVWLLVGWAPPSSFPHVRGDFEEMAASWTTEVRSEGPAKKAAAPANDHPTSADRAVETAALTWLVLALAAAAILAARRLPRPDWLVGGAVFVLAAGLLFVLVQLPTLGFTLLGLSRGALPQLSLGGVQSVVAVATLLALAWLAVSRRRVTGLRELLALLFVLNGGLLAVYWIDRGFAGGVATGGRFSLVQAVLVLAALLWDVVMSGEAITNRHNRHFPRHTRVLVYLGYVMLVATAVLFFSSLRIQGTTTSIEPQFESEGYVEDGLLFLGTALLVTLFVLRLSRLRLRRG